MEKCEKSAGIATKLPKNLFLVRHGQTTANIGGSLDKNSQLTALGAAQALEVGIALAHIHPTAIIHTGLDRTLETAELVALGGGFGVPFIGMDKFRERDMGIYDGVGAVERLRRQPGMEEQVQTYGGSFVWFAEGTEQDGIEPLAHMRQRILEGLREIGKLYGNQPVILIAHEGSIKMAELLYQGVEDNIPERLATRRVSNCEVLNFS